MASAMQPLSPPPSAPTGRVKEVKQEVAGLYYNVTLIVEPASSGVGGWYRTPGQYVDLLPEGSKLSPAAFFIASAVPYKPGRYELAVEFLIYETSEPSAANELISSKPDDIVRIYTNPESKGFDLQKLEAPGLSVRMFASGYGLGPIRAYIETGFGAPLRRDAILQLMYWHNQGPYKHKIPEWEQSGVVVEGSWNQITLPDPAKTVVLMVASKTEQKKLTAYFLQQGVPHDQILTLFDGYPTDDEEVARANKAYLSKGSKEHHFLPMGKSHVPFALKL